MDDDYKEMMITIDNFLFMGIAISLFAIALTLSKQPNQISDKILVAFLLSIIVPMFISLTKPADINQLIIIQRIDDFMPLTLGPFIAIYTESLTKTNYVLTKRSLTHFLPFCLFFLAGICYSQFTFSDVGNIDSEQVDPFQFVYSATFFLSIICYSIWLPQLLKKHRNRVLDYFTHNPSHLSLRWLSWLVYLGFIIFAIAHIPIILDALELFPSDSYFKVIGTDFRAVGFVIFLPVLSFFGVQQTQVFPDSAESLAEEQLQNIPMELDADSADDIAQASDIECVSHIEETIYSKKKNRTRIINDEQLHDYLEKLESYFKHEKPYLNSELTLGSLAISLNMPKHHLTETLNRKLQKNFYSYVNEYRLVVLKELLVDPNNASQAILELAYQAGFNSKTTFNNFFKKSMRMTPSQYRKSAITDK